MHSVHAKDWRKSDPTGKTRKGSVSHACKSLHNRLFRSTALRVHQYKCGTYGTVPVVYPFKLFIKTFQKYHHSMIKYEND